MTLGMQHANTYGVAQGGTIYTLADMSMGYKVLSELPPEKTVHTIEMKMNYIRPGKGKYLYAIPEILHTGRSTAVMSCQVRNDGEQLIAQGLGTFFIGSRD
jgi:acyl-CoA thioesterase